MQNGNTFLLILWPTSQDQRHTHLVHKVTGSSVYASVYFSARLWCLFRNASSLPCLQFSLGSSTGAKSNQTNALGKYGTDYLVRNKTCYPLKFRISVPVRPCPFSRLPV
jgi:hypothetical protein